MYYLIFKELIGNFNVFVILVSEYDSEMFYQGEEETITVVKKYCFFKL